MGYQVLEHTADVGLRATGKDGKECFREATLGLLDILGAFAPEETGETENISVKAQDRGGLLVEWLSEVLWLHDARDAVITSVEMESVDETSARGRLGLLPRRQELEGTAVKAITYHRLEVTATEKGWVAQVFLDI